ncbi:MAG: tRNA pseudouridine synthase A [Cyclobacteriaceae bacterium]|nr:MAG: tRNA pseudouridine synthase A [Cyclobacteriaceae bacterium]
MRYFIELSYNGKAYHGWQLQKNAHSIQQEFNNALEVIFKQKIETVGSGRTDSGVHALQQVCHLDLEQPVDVQKSLYRLNSLLPNDIAVKRMFKVPDSAHARFDAISRSYRYFITTVKNPFETETSYYFSKQISMQHMNEAATVLLGEQNFKSFCKKKSSADHYVCTINHASWQVDNDRYCFYVSANRFLRGMVRALVGTLLDVGTGKISIDQFKTVIAAQDRRKAGRAAPAQGLFLTEVVYPDQILTNY